MRIVEDVAFRGKKTLNIVEDVASGAKILRIVEDVASGAKNPENC